MIAEAVGDDPWGMLTRVARELRVEGVQVRGRNGLLFGSVHDEAVMRSYSLSGAWAERTLDLLSSVLVDGGLYVDVGANVGSLVVPVAQNPRVRCLAFEPEPRNFRHLAANVVGLPNVEVRQVACFSTPSKLRFELSPNNMGDHRIRLSDKRGEMGEDRWEVIEVDALPLDSLVPAGAPLAVKVDTQGAEPFVVQGGRAVLERADVVIMEYAPYWMERMGADRNVVLDFLRGRPEVAIAFGEHDPPVRYSGVDAVGELSGLPSDNSTYVDVIFGQRELPFAAAPGAK
jgi:FkbM family methyltransferase